MMTIVNPVAGTLVFLLGGIAAATYLLPFRGVRGWAYETGWLVSVLAGWLVFPLVFDAIVIPDVAQDARAAGSWDLRACGRLLRDGRRRQMKWNG